MKMTICSWSPYKADAVPLTKARWKRFIKWPLRGQESSAVVPFNWKGLWLFLHPPSFCSLSANTMLDMTEQLWNSMDGARNRMEQDLAPLLFTSYANSIICLFSVPGKHQHLDKEHQQQSHPEPVRTKEICGGTSALESLSSPEQYLTSNYHVSSHTQFFFFSLPEQPPKHRF